MKQVFAPGCALMIYKPHLADKMLDFLNHDLGGIDDHQICCKHEPKLQRDTRVINVCPGCDRRYRELYDGVTTISLWEILADSKTFPFPDYGGMTMSVLDACPTRDQVRVHIAIRTLLKRMNIDPVEPKSTGTKSVCCGDSFFGEIPLAQVKKQMRKRAMEMPSDDVAVYCVSCAKAMHIGGRNPRYMVDLLFGEETEPKTYEPESWHKEVDAWVESH
jgi:Fe-S oxidoreductase